MMKYKKNREYVGHSLCSPNVRPSEDYLRLSTVPSNKLKCDLCHGNRGDFSSLWDLRSHQKNRHGLKLENDDLFKSVEKFKNCTCVFYCPNSKCLEQNGFKSFYVLKRHYVRSHLDPTHKCVECDNVFYFVADLTRHLKKLYKFYFSLSYFFI